MDIIVDTNVLASDFQLKSAKFSTLLDHIKRTDGSFVLLESVITELVAVYKRELTARLDRAKVACSNLGRLIGKTDLTPDVDLERELADLSKRLNSLSEKTQCIVHKASVDLMEVVRRGANRIRPANENGEELRDVIVWLGVLQYVTSSRRDTAFITTDKGFWSGTDLHEQILKDLLVADGRLHVYRDIETFISRNNMQCTPVDQAWLSKYLELNKISETALVQLRLALQADYYSFKFEISLDTFWLSKGVAYEVSPNSTFVEFQCDLSVSLKVSSESTTSGIVVRNDLNNWFASPAGVMTTVGSIPTTTNISIGSVTGVNSALSGISGISTKAGSINPNFNLANYNSSTIPGFYSNWISSSGGISFSSRKPPEKVAGIASFTMRILDETLQRVDLDQLIY